MAEITRKRTGEFLRKLFEILIKHPEGLQAGVALEQLASVVTLSEYEAGNYESSGTRRFDKIVRFATVDCAKAGWLLKQKGIWTITESGIQAYNAYTDPEAFYREAVRLYHVWRATQPGKVVEAPEATTELEPDHAESATITYEQAEEQAWTEIEKHLHGMNPYGFQKLVADLLQAMGYYVSWVSPPGKDGGVDIIAFTDALGTKLPRIKVQVKRVGQRIDKDGLRSSGSMMSVSMCRQEGSLAMPKNLRGAKNVVRSHSSISTDLSNSGSSTSLNWKSRLARDCL